MGHRVTLRGRWLADKQVAVVNREGNGKPGVWIVTALQLASGPTVGVVRGWLPMADSPGADAPAGPVVVEAVVQADENFYASAVSAPGTVASIGNLSEVFGQPMLPGYVVLTSEEPPAAPAPIPVPAQVSTDVPFPLRNFVYALQWWLFGLFAVAVFVRWLWRDNTVH
jgi:cytochrome oxidase assembly protein ShyY1